MNARRVVLLAATIVTVLVGSVHSSAQTTTGYVHVVLAGGGKYSLIANPFNTTNNTFAGLFSHLPPGTQFLKWDKTNADFVVLNRVSFGSGWNPASGAAATLNPGEGAFVLLQGADVTNTFAGNVLSGNLTNKFVTGYNLVGNLAPDSGSVFQLQLHLPPIGSQILKWDRTIQDYIVFNTVTFGTGWAPYVPTIGVAEGFFVNASAPFEWIRNFTTP